MTETTLFFKKAWIWLKTHWYLPLLLIALVCVWWSGRARTERILKMFDASKESYKKQIDVLNKTHEEELRKREKLYSTYMATLKTLEKEHKINLESLEEEKRIELDEMVKKYEGSPEDLAEELKRLFGV